ncbi:MAG: tape measure protein [Pseudomonadota bacterium]
MAEEVAALQVRLEATQQRFERDMQRATRSLDRAAGRMERRAGRLDTRLRSVGTSFGVNLDARSAAAAASIAGVGVAIADVVKNGDSLLRLEGRFTALTGSADRARDKIADIFRIATTTGVDFESVANSMTRFTIATERLGKSDQEVAQLVEDLTKLGRLGGGTTSEISAGLQQLGQALSSGVLQGDELRSLRENLPLVVNQIADGLGVAAGELKQLGADGELTAERVFGALQKGTDDIEERFRQLPVTVDRAAGELSTAWTQFTGKLDESIGLSRVLVDILQTAALLLNGTLGETRARVQESEAAVRATSNGRAGSIRTDGGTTLGSANRNGLDPEDPRRNRGQAGRNPFSGLGEALSNLGDQAETTSRDVSDASDKSADAFQAVASQMLRTVASADSFKDALKQIGLLLLDIVAQGIGGKGPASGLGDAIGSALGGLFGARETGGPVQAGKPYIVGEKRRELFVPNQSGRIIPHVPDAAPMQSGAAPIAIGGTTINISQPGASPAQIEQIVARNNREMVRQIQQKQIRNPGFLPA